jgi:hypothetical protein
MLKSSLHLVWRIVKNGFEGNLAIAGKVPSSTSIQLYEGWNFVGYPSLTNKTVGDALSGIIENVDMCYKRLRMDHSQLIPVTS